MVRVARALLLLFLAALLVSCGEESPTAPTLPNISINVPTTIIVGGVPTASPSPGTGGDLPAGSYVRIGMFGQSCGSGVTVPPNGSRQIKPGCTASITATPKDSAGVDLPAAIHGPSIAWSIPAGSGVVNCLADSNPFNRTCGCIGRGVFTLQATVKSLTGTADFECVP